MVARNLPAATGKIEASGKPATVEAKEIETREGAIAKLEGMLDLLK